MALNYWSNNYLPAQYWPGGFWGGGFEFIVSIHDISVESAVLTLFDVESFVFTQITVPSDILNGVDIESLVQSQINMASAFLPPVVESLFREVISVMTETGESISVTSEMSPANVNVYSRTGVGLVVDSPISEDQAEIGGIIGEEN